MKLPDVNLFVYAYDASAPQHESAKRWLEDVLSGSETVAFAWVALLGFVRLTTSRQRFGRRQCRAYTMHPATPPRSSGNA